MFPHQNWIAIVLAINGFQVAFAAEQPPSLQKEIVATLREVSPAVVSLWYGKPERHVTGTCISDSGLILTCGHLKREIGDEVEVRCEGKKPKAAKVIAKHKKLDVALLQVAGDEKWTDVPIGDSKNLTLEDPLLGIGFGNTSLYGNPPGSPIKYTRLGYTKQQRLWPQKDVLLTTISTKGGDSGCPLFDHTGALVGVCSIGEADGSDTRYVSSEALLREWDTFAKDVTKPARKARRRVSFLKPMGDVEKTIAETRPSVVEVQLGNRWLGFGVYIGRGMFLTKASELTSKVTIVLADGTVAAVEIAARDPASDLFLLRILNRDLADGLPEIKWAERADTPEGTLVVAVTPAAFTSPMGMVCVAPRSVPPITGTLPIRVKDGKGGVTITDTFVEMTTPWLRPPTFPLQTGDVITTVAGESIRTKDAFDKLLFGVGKLVGLHPRVAGEAVEVTWRRDGKKSTNWIHLRLQQSSASQSVTVHGVFCFSENPLVL